MFLLIPAIFPNIPTKNVRTTNRYIRVVLLIMSVPAMRKMRIMSVSVRKAGSWIRVIFALIVPNMGNVAICAVIIPMRKTRYREDTKKLVVVWPAATSLNIRQS